MKSLRIVLLLLSAALAACTPSRRDTPSDKPVQQGETPAGPVRYPYRMNAGVLPRNAEEISGQAVMSLLNQARVERDSGRPELAMAALERAQRIEPRNPFIWQQLAATHLAQSRLLEAENMAQRSNSLASSLLTVMFRSPK